MNIIEKNCGEDEFLEKMMANLRFLVQERDVSREATAQQKAPRQAVSSHIRVTVLHTAERRGQGGEEDGRGDGQAYEEPCKALSFLPNSEQSN
jgi:hypothetical protein